MSTRPARFLASHNALRGVAALAVFAYHLQLDPNYQLPLGVFAGLIDRGYLWVDFFFMLSGYVLSFSYLDRLGAGSLPNAFAFFRARIARIVPMHFAALALLAIIIALWRPSRELLGGARFWTFLDAPDLGHLAMQAALIQVWSAGAALSWNIPSWSISAEMHVYLIVPLLAVAVARFPQLSRYAMLGVALLIYSYFFAARTSLDILDKFAILRCLAGFLVGASIERWIAGRGHVSGRSVTAMQFGAIMGIATVLVTARSDVLAIPFFALLITSTAGDRGLLARPLSRPTAQTLGRVSYSTYLLNFPVILLGDLAWRTFPILRDEAGIVTARLMWCFALTAALIGAAIVTFRFVERPFRTLLKLERPELSDASPVALVTATDHPH